MTSDRLITRHSRLVVDGPTIWRAAANQTWQDWLHGHALMENSLNCATRSVLDFRAFFFFPAVANLQGLRIVRQWHQLNPPHRACQAAPRSRLRGCAPLDRAVAWLLQRGRDSQWNGRAAAMLLDHSRWPDEQQNGRRVALPRTGAHPHLACVSMSMSMSILSRAGAHPHLACGRNARAPVPSLPRAARSVPSTLAYG